jgi:N-acetylglucosamine-6-phosphate deacetylase
MLFKNAAVFYRGRFSRLDIRIADGMIAEVGENLPGGGRDCAGKRILPGLIDIHTHGCAGEDFSFADAAGMSRMTRHYAQNGVTGVCAATITLPIPDLRRAISGVCCTMDAPRDGARILGINMEGPFLSPEKAGAHNAEWLIEPLPALFSELIDAHIIIANIDPSLPGALGFIEQTASKTVVSLAHTPADYALALKAIRAGARHVTHLFNAMNGLHHREPGVIGAFADSGITAELICDGHHIHPAVIRLMFAAYGERIALISDSMSAAGLQDGVYTLGGQEVTVKRGCAALRDGTMAGSAATLFACMKNAIREGVPEEKAIRSATEIPAKIVGMEDEAGFIEPGRQADLLVCGEDYTLEQVYIGGIQQ